MDVEDVLSKSAEGNEILEFYKKNKFIYPNHQQKISNFMVDHVICKRKILSVNDRIKLSNSICSYFVGENPVSSY